MKLVRGLALTMLCLPALAASGVEPASVATAVPEPVTLEWHNIDDNAHREIVDALAEAKPGTDSLPTRAKWNLTLSLNDLESVCRSHLWDKEEEPGSPSLVWRPLGSYASGGSRWYLGSLSCEDVLCGGLVTHARLALLHVGPTSSRLAVVPGTPATVDGEMIESVDSVAVFAAADHVLIEARRHVRRDNPCLMIMDTVDEDEALFVVVRGDSVSHSFRLVPNSIYADHDDETGGSSEETAGTLRVSAGAIDMRTTVASWPSADSTRAEPDTTRNTLRLTYDRRSGTFAASP